MTVTVDLEGGFVSSAVFFLMRFCRWFQGKIATAFSWIFISPALAFSRLLNAERSLPLKQRRKRENKDRPFVILDCLKWSHKALWQYLRAAFFVNSKINGVASHWDIYERLLTWNTKLPLIGFVQDKTTFTIELLLGKGENGDRYCDFVWLSSYEIHGIFRIIGKEIVANRPKEVRINCVWLVGKDKGKIFYLTSLGAFEQDKEIAFPSSIYYPPRILVVAFEGLLSISALLALLELTKDGWKLVTPYIGQVWRILTDSLGRLTCL